MRLCLPTTRRFRKPRSRIVYAILNLQFFPYRINYQPTNKRVEQENRQDYTEPPNVPYPCQPRTGHGVSAPAAVALLFALLLLSITHHCASAQGAEIDDSGAASADSVAVDVFVASDYAEFWWDPADIPGCVSVDIRRDGQPYDLEACAMPPWRDISVEAGTSYTYRFYFLDDEDNALPPQLGIGALVTPGIYQGTLHTTAALQGPDAQAGNITLAKDAILTIDGVHLTGGSISDDAGRQDTLCSSEVGRVTAAGAAFQDTVFHLCNPTSSVKSSYGNATVNIFAAASVTGNTLASVVVSDESAGHAVIEDNIFVGTGVQVTGESQATIRGCEFQQSSYARFRDQSSGTVEKCTFDSDASVPVLLETKNNVTVYGNEIKLKNSASDAAAILIDPLELSSDPPFQGPVPYFEISSNTLTGPNGGTGIRVHRESSDEVGVSLGVYQNTISHFEDGVVLGEGLYMLDDYAGLQISAQILQNTIVNSVHNAVSTQLYGSEDSVSLAENCIADNAYGLWCSNPDIVVDAVSNFWGSKDGPAHASNPGGDGDTVMCKEEQVDVSAWLESHTCSISGLAVAGIEAVQSVQTLANTVPLVEGTQTLVRVYPDAEGGFSGSVTGSLTGYRDGALLGVLQSAQAVSAGSVDDWNAIRGDLDASLNYMLPETWLHGTVDLVATLELPEASSAGVDEAPELKTSVGFSPRKNFKIAYIPINLDANGQYYPVNAGDVLDVHRAINAVYPLGDVDFLILPDETILYSTLPVGDDARASGTGLVYYARAVKETAQQHSDFDADLYIAVNGMEGNEWVENHGGYDLSIGQCSTTDEGRGCLYLAGLNLGLRPVSRADLQRAPSRYLQYAWPYGDATTQEFGFNFDAQRLTTPEYWDVMSQQAAADGLPSGISPYHYERAFEALNPAPDAEGHAAQAAAGPGLWVTGIAGKSSGHLYPVERIDSTTQSFTPENPAGAYCVQAIGSASVLDEYCFDLDLEQNFVGVTESSIAFDVFLDPLTNVQSFRLQHGGDTLAQLDVPGMQAAIALQSAQVDATYGALAVRWTVTAGTHADLRYRFLYSPDDGATWRTLAVAVHLDQANWTDGAFQWGVSATQVPPGNAARIRVIATDGYHQAEATSAAFAVSDTGPRVGIRTPANNAVVDSFPLSLSGFAYDAVDGDRGGSLQWSSSLDGDLGGGETISVASLSSGAQIITLTGSDGAGHSSEAQVRITVGSGSVDPLPGDQHTYLPSIQR